MKKDLRGLHSEYLRDKILDEHEIEEHQKLPPLRKEPDQTMEYERDMSDENVWWGCVGMMGWRSGMEDDHINETIELHDGTTGYLHAVFDGHGGRRVAKMARENLKDYLRETKEFKKGDYKKAMQKTFLSLDTFIG